MLRSSKLTYLIRFSVSKKNYCHGHYSLHLSFFSKCIQCPVTRWLASWPWDCADCHPSKRSSEEENPKEKVVLILTIWAGEVSWRSEHSHRDLSSKKIQPIFIGIGNIVGGAKHNECESSVYTAQKDAKGDLNLHMSHLIPGLDSCKLNSGTSRDCEGKFHCHHTACILSVGSCGRKNPIA